MRHPDESQLNEIAVAPHVESYQLTSVRENLASEVSYLDLDLASGLMTCEALELLHKACCNEAFLNVEITFC